MTTTEAAKMGYVAVRRVPGQGICGIHSMAFTTGLFVGITEDSYVGRYCYPNTYMAVKALTEWDGEGDPDGEWIKWKGKGGDRPRVPDPFDELIG